MPSTWLPHVNTINESRYSTKEYNLITQSKSYIVSRLINHNFTVFLTDVDVAWLSPNIVHYIDYNVPHKDFIYAVDVLSKGENVVNTGFYVARPTNEVKKMFNSITELQKKELGNDGDFMHLLFTLYPELSCTYGYALDKMLFSNGQTYCHHRMNKKLGIKPLIFHVNYFIGFEKKKRVLIEEGIWFLQ